MSQISYVHPTALIDPTARLGQEARIGDEVTIKEGSVVGACSTIDSAAYIGKVVTIGSNVAVHTQAMVLDGAKICKDSVEVHSTNARQIGMMASIGEDVVLHGEVELGVGAIVPSQRTITHLGHLGSKNRVVTIYGSEVGPRYSVGCQVGVSLDKIAERVNVASNTARESADSYIPYLPIFDSLGQVVQKAYDQERATIDAMMQMRIDLGLDLPDNLR